MINKTENSIREIESSRHQLTVRVAWLYYEEQMTQAEIGEHLGISRITVNRLLKEARESGIVEIKIRSPYATTLPLSRELSRAYELKDVYLTPPTTDDEEMRLALARAAALALEGRLAPGATIGVGIGRTVSNLPDFLHPSQPASCRFTSLTGGLLITTQPAAHNFDVLSRLAGLTGGQCFYIPAPSIVSDTATRDTLTADPSVQRSLEVARSSQVAIFSVGEAETSSLLYQSGLLTDNDLAELRQQQAFGDVLGRYFDSQGRELDTRINHRIIGLTIEELKRIPVKILVAGGSTKHLAIRALLQNRVGDVLVTDPGTAEWLATTR